MLSNINEAKVVNRTCEMLLILGTITPFLAVQNKKHIGTADSLVYWEFLKQACKSVPYNCIQKINLMDNVKTIRGKVCYYTYLYF